jgi:hypothetical protein
MKEERKKGRNKEKRKENKRKKEIKGRSNKVFWEELIVCFL